MGDTAVITCLTASRATSDAEPEEYSPPPSGFKIMDNHVALFPLPTLVSFPGVVIPLKVFEPRYRMMVRDSLEKRMDIGLVLLKPGWEADYFGSPALHDIGVSGPITHLVEKTPDLYEIRISAEYRFRILSEVQTVPYRIVQVESLPGSLGDMSRMSTWADLNGLKGRLLDLFDRYCEFLVGEPPDPSSLSIGIRALVNLMCFYSRATPEQKQGFLEQPLLERTHAITEFLIKDLESLEEAKNQLNPSEAVRLQVDPLAPAEDGSADEGPSPQPSFRLISSNWKMSQDLD